MKKENVIIELVGVSKVYNETTAVDNFNFYVKKGEFVSFLGPSGCGKTTTLRMIAGFESPDEGEIYLGDQAINARTVAAALQCSTQPVFSNFATMDELRLAVVEKADILCQAYMQRVCQRIQRGSDR